jgi:hypothetical protein
MSEQWIKMPATEEYTGSLNLDEVHAQMGPLESPVKIEFLRLERVDGLDCYMLSVTPNMTALGQWLTEEQGPNEGFSWEEMVKLSEIFKKIEYTCYVTRDSNYLKRISSSIVMEYTSEQAGVAAGEFDKMMMEIRADMNLYDYDMPFSVTLPDEAASATEVSGDTASN